MSVNITLEEIIKRKIQYHANDTDEELFAMNKGYIRGFEEILKDIDSSEEDFIIKYIGKLRELSKVFEKSRNGEKISDDIDELSGYNNAIVDVLALLDEKLMYADNI